jgi:hypothetical protein
MTTTVTSPASHASKSPANTLGARAFWFFGVLVFLLFVTESVFFIVAFQLPDDRLPELREPAVASSSTTGAVGIEAKRSEDAP